jgi:hypothetical protein
MSMSAWGTTRIASSSEVSRRAVDSSTCNSSRVREQVPERDQAHQGSGGLVEPRIGDLGVPEQATPLEALPERLDGGDLQGGEQRRLRVEVRVDRAHGAVDAIGDGLHRQPVEPFG